MVCVRCFHSLSLRCRACGVLLALIVLATCGGCVRRTLQIDTEPQGASIYLNDEEVGRSPVSVDFLWYGDYDVVARLDGYQTLVTHSAIKAPWYQRPVFSFFSEILYPGWIHDEREMRFSLAPEEYPDPDALRERAAELRERALFEAD